MYPEYRFALEEWDYGNKEGLLIFRYNEDGSTERAKIEWVDHKDGWALDVESSTMILKAARGVRRPISSLMIRALQECGELRRHQVTDTADLRGWLEDMRRIVFNGAKND